MLKISPRNLVRGIFFGLMWIAAKPWKFPCFQFNPQTNDLSIGAWPPPLCDEMKRPRTCINLMREYGGPQMKTRNLGTIRNGSIKYTRLNQDENRFNCKIVTQNALTFPSDCVIMCHIQNRKPKEVKKKMIKLTDIAVIFEDLSNRPSPENERFSNDVQKNMWETLNNLPYEATSIVETLRKWKYWGEVPSISLVSGKLIITVGGFIDPGVFIEEEKCQNE